MKYRLNLSVQSEVVDDRLKRDVDAAQKVLQEQAAAYVDVVLRDQLITKLTKAFGPWYPQAQLAQIAVDVLVEELKHTSIFLSGIQAQLTETKEADPAPLQLPAPPKHLTEDEMEQLRSEDDVRSDGEV